MNKNLVLLDLEETLIESFTLSHILPYNIAKVEHFLSTLEGDTKLGLMSWAIWEWSQVEKALFDEVSEQLTAKGITQEFDPDFLLTIKDWEHFLQDAIGSTKVPLAIDKPELLFRARSSKAFNPYTNVFLIDDMVEHNLVVTSKHITLTVLNISSMCIN